MSGGVDSSVTACLLKLQGHDVIGVRFRLWQDPKTPAHAQILPTKCCDVQTVNRARMVAKQLGIPLHEVDLRKIFKHRVVDPYIASSCTGLTPNPCVLCNRVFKCTELLKLAKKLKCDAVATGHYARLRKNRDGSVSILEARDPRKDQSYFLSRLTQAQLRRCVLPLGTRRKTEVYALAKKFRIPVEKMTYRESQDLCFFPEQSPAAFLRRYIKKNPGPIITRSGTVIGTHEGLAFYTVGQRRGLNIGGLKIPVHVVGKDRRTNALIVAPRGEDTSHEAMATSLSFPATPLPRKHRVTLHARIRASGERHRGTFTHDGKRGTFRFAKPVRGVTPGQALVLYKGKEIVGSGVIEKAKKD